MSPAFRRTESSETQAVPRESPTVPSWSDSVSASPEGEVSLSSTGTVTTSPTRTTAVSEAVTGTCASPEVMGTTVTCPVAVEAPLDTVYSRSTCSGTLPEEVICSREWLTTVTVTPDSGGAEADWSTRIPPEGSKSFSRGEMVTAPPSRSRAVSFSGTGGTEESEAGATSTRITPLATAAPADTS